LPNDVRYIELACSISDIIRSSQPMAIKPKPAAAPPNPAHPPRVGERIQALRQAEHLSMDELSRRAGVSKSMLSQIERNQANPTVAVVWRLANALEVPLAELLGTGEPAPPTIVTVPAHATPALRTPDQRCELRILGPVELAGQFEWYELTVQPGGALESQPHEPGSREHLSVLSGTLEVTAGDATQRLKHGETARYAVDMPHAIRNPGKTVASALLVVLHSA
jgi:transcriptional regulator with XRE-family HTH domain